MDKLKETIHKTLQEGHKDMLEWTPTIQNLWVLAKPIIPTPILLPANGRLSLPVTTDGINAYQVILWNVNQDTCDLLNNGGLVEINGASMSQDQYGIQIKPNR